MFFGPQKVSSDYSRKKMVLLAAVVTTGAQATVLKTCVLSTHEQKSFHPSFSLNSLSS